MAKQSSKKKTTVVKKEWKFKKGESCKVYGALNIIDNSNITEEIAKHLLKKGYVTEEQFL